MILPLGKTLLQGRAAALAVFDALVDMAQRCDSVLEEMALRREAYELIIAMRIDELGANEDNIKSVCTVLAQASVISAHGYDEETFWLEVTMPEVFVADEFEPATTQTSYVSEKRRPVIDDTPQPEWLTDVMKAVKEERELLAFEDFVVNRERFFILADMYGAFKQVSADVDAEFIFKQPELPMKEHGACYLAAEKLTLRKADIQTLLSLISQASSLGITYCADNRVRLGVEVSNIYDRRA